jgi:uncharacterized protein
MEDQPMTANQLPEHCQGLPAEQEFTFACHPGVPCFTECCRELDLALSPYDVLRLKKSLGLTSDQFLEQYVLVEWQEDQVLPVCYLTMVDDGRASCVFVGPQGCAVYADRPGSCRAYPVGRGVARNDDGTLTESLVLLQEPHCRGFAEPGTQTAGTYLSEQGLERYNRFNDALLPLYQHRHIRNKTFRPTRRQFDQYMLALYDLDQFRKEMTSGRIALQRPLHSRQLQGLAGDDEELLVVGIEWLLQEWFDEQ